MKYLGKITDNKDLVTKEYVDGSIPDVSDKQDVIEVDGILEGDGEGNISAAEIQEVTTLNIDSAPTANSSNLVTSGGVYAAIQAGGGGISAETDPVFSASPAAGITQNDIDGWDAKISTETDPTVPSWAKASTKPTYTASEVGAAESSHVHGNITNGGDITATAPTIASGDQIIINDHSASKITNGPTFDGSTTSKYLSQKGTWESVPTISYPVTSVNSKTGAVVLSNTDVGAAATSHTHGNIQNGGTLQTSDITIANGDKLVVTDSSDSSKVARASISFDGSTTSKYLSQKGTWENAPTAASIGALTSESDPVFGASAAAGISSADISNWNAKQNALTIDSTPTNGSGNPVSSDGTYDMVMGRTKIYTASCSTAAGTAAKVATLDDSTGFSLAAGIMVAVRFTYGNSATTPTLNVSSTGAKTIAVPSSATAYTTGNGTTYNTWGAYETVLFTYTGTYWVHLPSGYLGYLAYNLASNAVPQTRTINSKALSSNITLSASDIGALPSSTSIPTKVSDLQNDSGFITGYIETDPTVPSWAKASSKPSYTASEVGAAPTSHASTATTYGAGTSSNYGHVKLSDSTSSTSSTTGGIAATPAAVKAAYDLANGKQASITASGILKGNGSGTITAAVAGTDYQAPLPSQTNNSGKALTTDGSTLSWTNMPGVFTAEYNVTSYADIVAAYNAGKYIIVTRSLNGTTIYGFTDINDSGTYYFRSFSNQSATNYGCYIDSSGTWNVNSYTYATTSSPTFTGTPTAPTATAGTNTTQIATTAFVQTALQNVDSQPKIKTGTITTTTTWSGSGPYTQTVTLTGYTATANTKVDIQPTAAQITQLMTDGVTSMLVSNNNGTLTVYTTGAKPSAAMTIQVTCTEVTAA